MHLSGAHLTYIGKPVVYVYIINRINFIEYSFVCLYFATGNRSTVLVRISRQLFNFIGFQRIVIRRHVLLSLFLVARCVNQSLIASSYLQLQVRFHRCKDLYRMLTALVYARSHLV